MLNSGGGVILIGALERDRYAQHKSDRLRLRLGKVPAGGRFHVIGLQDPIFRERGWDGFELKFNRLLKESIEGEIANLVHVSRDWYKEQTLAVVRVDYADEVWASEGELMEPNTTVGGHPAWVQDDTAAYTVYLLDEGRPAVSVSVHGEGAVDRFGPAQANELALSVQVLGSWTDRSQWTDNPLQ